MSRPRATTMLRAMFVVCMVIAILLIPGAVASANSTAPPSVVWLTFDDETPQAPRLLGVQLLACPTIGCEQPVLLQQYGTCNGAGCVTSPPK